MAAGRVNGEGIPYTKSKHIFMSIYESLDGSDMALKARALTGVFRSSGEDMIRAMFHNSSKPEEPCNPGMALGAPNKCPYNNDSWCAAGRILARNAMKNAPTIRALPSDPTPDDILPHCFDQVREGDRWPLIVY